MLRIVQICLVFVALSAAAQEHYVPYLQQKQLLEIGECTTPSCVDSVVSRAPYLDPPLRLIAASKLNQLDPSLAQNRLLEALPRDPVAFGFCYSVTVPSLGNKFQQVRKLYDLYFPAAAQAASRDGKRVRDFLLLRVFADGEMAAALEEDVALIRKQSPAAYCNALKTLHVDVRGQLPSCDEREKGRKE